MLKLSSNLHKLNVSSSWLSRTDPADVARVESLTFISTQNKRETVPIPKEGVKGSLGE